ncbi:Indole-3-glycerol phosphate synthase [Botrimarina colliarenosi]|uniref:Indole-3-glycerol phosphate synthase n=1 Tax=Botrimarina colliarenosi TaxID=2528001 RepID=A0A5C6AJ18_9BACT|nr:indole-3-glycerol phosphate synthase TrpC [Botrimarina colliarenosi]TWT99400.1 Indole-3-glycerol phosphate synthase [Botrimarina colliarenosi]
MPTVLDKIVAVKRQEVALARAERPLVELRAALADAPPVRDYLAPLAADRPAPTQTGGGGPIKLIAEVKKASPSAGLIRADFDAVAIAQTYAACGASCLSCLTDEPHFQGSLDYLRAVRAAVDLPVLRKDFLIDEHQLVEARVAGADAVLLIAECLAPAELADLHALANELGMTALVELYDPANLPAVLACGPTLVGVNNRNLHTMKVDLEHCIRLRAEVPPEVVFVGESGVKTHADAQRLRGAGIDAMLVGESLMRQADIGVATKALLLG